MAYLLYHIVAHLPFGEQREVDAYSRPVYIKSLLFLPLAGRTHPVNEVYIHGRFFAK